MKSGIVYLDKKVGMTTLKDEYTIRKNFHTDKTGHGGTLDPFASGLVLIGINKGTKVLPFYENKKKTYRALLQLGEQRDTGDKDGKTVLAQAYRIHEENEIQDVLHSFLGESEQLPPMYSALKKNGVPLYKFAYKGIEVERKPRKIQIDAISLVHYNPEKGTIEFEVKVSKGTYIRVLGEDIAKKLREVGYLTALRRTAVGNISVSEAKKAEDIKESDIVPIREIFQDLPQVRIDEDQMKRVQNGTDMKLTPAQLDFSSPAMILVCDSEGEGLALYQKADGTWYKSFKQFI